jgi:hypothetical protein
MPRPLEHCRVVSITVYEMYQSPHVTGLRKMQARKVVQWQFFVIYFAFELFDIKILTFFFWRTLDHLFIAWPTVMKYRYSKGPLPKIPPTNPVEYPKYLAYKHTIKGLNYPLSKFQFQK